MNIIHPNSFLAANIQDNLNLECDNYTKTTHGLNAGGGAEYF